MFEIVAKLLGTGLDLWLSHEKNKYIDELIRIKKERYEEENKVPPDRDDALLDNLEFQLRVLSDSFIASASKQNATDK